MDHTFIEIHNIVDRYEMGKLSESEYVEFEEHLVDCPDCQKLVDETRAFLKAIRTAAAEDQKATGFNLFPAPPLSSAWRWAFLTSAACAVLMIFPLVSMLRETHRIHGELSRMANEAGGYRRLYEAERQTAGSLQKQIADAEKESAPAAGTVPALATVLALSVTRSAGDGSAPADRAVLSKNSQSLVLSLDLDGNDFSGYRAALSRSGGQALWKGEHLTPSAASTLSITFPPGFFHSGDYSIFLEGHTRTGSYAPAGHYSFRVEGGY